MSLASLYALTARTRNLSRPFQSVTQRTAKKFLRFERPTTKKFLRFYHAATKKFLRFPGLKLKRPAISHRKNFFLRTQKEVLACALFLGCNVSRLPAIIPTFSLIWKLMRQMLYLAQFWTLKCP